MRVALEDVAERVFAVDETEGQLGIPGVDLAALLSAQGDNAPAELLDIGVYDVEVERPDDLIGEVVIGFAHRRLTPLEELQPGAIRRNEMRHASRSEALAEDVPRELSEGTGVVCRHLERPHHELEAHEVGVEGDGAVHVGDGQTDVVDRMWLSGHRGPSYSTVVDRGLPAGDAHVRASIRRRRPGSLRWMRIEDRPSEQAEPGARRAPEPVTGHQSARTGSGVGGGKRALCRLP